MGEITNLKNVHVEKQEKQKNQNKHFLPTSKLQKNVSDGKSQSTTKTKQNEEESETQKHGKHVTELDTPNRPLTNNAVQVTLNRSKKVPNEKKQTTLNQNEENEEESPPHTFPMSPQAISSEWATVTHRKPIRDRQQTFENSDHAINQNRKTRSNFQSRIIHGTAKEEPSTSFTAATRRAWLSVGKVEENTKAEDIKDYLERKFKGYSFTVEPLPKQDLASSLAFKVGADMALIDQLYLSTTWLAGTIAQRYNFFRRKRSDRYRVDK